MGLDPAQIGRYRVLGTLGQGAMGTVYLAEDPALKRGVAIKVVRTGLGNREVLARFRREAEVSARLNHPNIITIFDVGEEAALGPFLAMELLEGQGLDLLVKAGPLPPEEAMRLLLQAGHALDAIHQAGIVHRDVKPSNFMVAKDGRLKLMDFGIARAGEAGLTTTAAFLGTPSYAAPESLAGSSASTEAVDRWALAVTAFEMLTGQLPFNAESLSAVLYRVVHEPPRLPESMDGPLKGVFERAFAKDPAQRHESINAFLRALLDALHLPESGHSVMLAQLEAPALSGGIHRPLRPRRNRIPKAAWIAMASAVTVLLGAGAMWYRAGRTHPVAIYSSPSGARVLLDGKEAGRTPLPALAVPVRGGRLSLDQPDYLPLDRVVGPEESRVELRMVPAPFRVEVVTEPAGAEIRLDGRPSGRSPRSIQVPGEGRHQLEIRAQGYDSWSSVLVRHESLPSPIRLAKQAAHARPPKTSKVKRILKDLLTP